jgi:hypothetical protein
MPGWESLQQYGVVTYEGPAIDFVRDYVARSSRLQAHGSTDPDRLRDYLLLCCGEAATGTSLLLPAGDPSESGPFIVNLQTAWFGVAKNNTSEFLCGLPANLETASLWDLVMFGGDMSKMSYLGVQSAQQLYDTIDQVLAHLRDGYAEAQARLESGRITTKHLVSLGACWIGKGACIAGDDPGERVQRFLQGVIA